MCFLRINKSKKCSTFVLWKKSITRILRLNIGAFIQDTTSTTFFDIQPLKRLEYFALFESCLQNR